MTMVVLIIMVLRFIRRMVRLLVDVLQESVLSVFMEDVSMMVLLLNLGVDMSEDVLADLLIAFFELVILSTTSFCSLALLPIDVSLPVFLARAALKILF